MHDKNCRTKKFRQQPNTMKVFGIVSLLLICVGLILFFIAIFDFELLGPIERRLGGLIGFPILILIGLSGSGPIFILDGLPMVEFSSEGVYVSLFRKYKKKKLLWSEVYEIRIIRHRHFMPSLVFLSREAADFMPVHLAESGPGDILYRQTDISHLEPEQTKIVKKFSIWVQIRKEILDAIKEFSDKKVIGLGEEVIDVFFAGGSIDKKQVGIDDLQEQSGENKHDKKVDFSEIKEDNNQVDELKENRKGE